MLTYVTVRLCNMEFREIPKQEIHEISLSDLAKCLFFQQFLKNNFSDFMKFLKKFLFELMSSIILSICNMLAM